VLRLLFGDLANHSPLFFNANELQVFRQVYILQQKDGGILLNKTKLRVIFVFPPLFAFLSISRRSISYTITMIFFSAFASVLLVSDITAAKNVHNADIRDIVVSPEPCAVVSSISSSFYSANPTRKYPKVTQVQRNTLPSAYSQVATTSLQIPAAIAYACQLSAPFIQELSLALIDYIVPYINFQSSIAYLKNPPSTYQMPAVDILGGLEEIRQNASSGVYTSQYAFDAAVTNLVLEAHDAHFVYVPALLSTFRYYNDLPLISISVDGLPLPKVYIGSR
jgi:hypothetical protein